MHVVDCTHLTDDEAFAVVLSSETRQTWSLRTSGMTACVERSPSSDGRYPPGETSQYQREARASSSSTLLTSGYPRTTDRLRFIPKPFAWEELAGEVNAAIRRRRRRFVPSEQDVAG